MKIAILNKSDGTGGAARAAYRLHEALRRSGMTSVLFVDSAECSDSTVIGPEGKKRKMGIFIRNVLDECFLSALKTKNTNLHSPAVGPSFWHKRLNASDFDIVHLHWINAGMLSIADIGRISRPLIWTLHDMWAFCGAEHYSKDFRWKEGYTRRNRPRYERGFDLNRWVWERKKRHWKRRFHIVTPSRWLGDCVSKSALMQHWPVTVIPNCIDTKRWCPIEKSVARQILQFPLDQRIVLFGAMNPLRDHRKGYDLLVKALATLKAMAPDLALSLVIFGKDPPSVEDFKYPVIFTGSLHDDISLRVLYSAADVMLIPSRQDNLPNTGIEAHACGTPVVGFDVCGLPDIVEHRRTGFLATPFDTQELALGIKWILEDPDRLRQMGLAARRRAEANWTYDLVARKYILLYEKVIGYRDDTF